jgi:uncharacterized membrane protein YfcA
LASIFGALAGLGGGIIIKPVLDFFGHYEVTTIGILSASTVFSMACVSLLTSINSDVKIHLKTSFLIAVGSSTGGVTGKLLFNYIVHIVGVSDIITVIQDGVIAILMVAILFLVKNKEKTIYNIKSQFITLLIGFILGVIAAFLGIGGGPFNVAILALLFSMGAKEAELNSIFIIFFSQLSSLLYTTFTTGFSELDLTMLPYMIVGGMLGGFLGSLFSKRVNSQFVEKVFKIGIIVIIFINLYNIGRYYVMY